MLGTRVRTLGILVGSLLGLLQPLDSFAAGPGDKIVSEIEDAIRAVGYAPHQSGLITLIQSRMKTMMDLPLSFEEKEKYLNRFILQERELKYTGEITGRDLLYAKRDIENAFQDAMKSLPKSNRITPTRSLALSVHENLKNTLHWVGYEPYQTGLFELIDDRTRTLMALSLPLEEKVNDLTGFIVQLRELSYRGERNMGGPRSLLFAKHELGQILHARINIFPRENQKTLIPLLTESMRENIREIIARFAYEPYDTGLQDLLAESLNRYMRLPGEFTEKTAQMDLFAAQARELKFKYSGNLKEGGAEILSRTQKQIVELIETKKILPLANQPFTHVTRMTAQFRSYCKSFFEPVIEFLGNPL